MADPFVGRCLTSPSLLRFHTPLIEPDVRISRIRLSDKGVHAVAHGRAGHRPALPSLRRAVPPAALEPSWAGRLSPMTRSVAASCTALELRPLPSAGITRLPRYYGPLRHLARPGLALAGRRWEVTRLHRRGFPCGTRSPVRACRRHYPGGAAGCFAPLAQRHRPSPFLRRVGPRITLFEACSAFTRVTACPLAESPCDPLHRRFQPLRHLHNCSDCYWQERQLPGGTHSR